MQLSSLFTLFFTLFALSLTVLAAPAPAPPSEERGFNLSGRVVDKRVGRALKQFRPKHPTPVIVARNDDNNNGYNGHNNGYNNGNDKHDKVVGNYGDGGHNGEQGGSRTKDNNYGGEGKDGYGSGGWDYSPKPPKPSSWPTTYGYTSGHY